MARPSTNTRRPANQTQAQPQTPAQNVIINWTERRLGVSEKCKLLGSSAIGLLEQVKEILNGKAAAEALAAAYVYYKVADAAEVGRIQKANEALFGKKGRKPNDENIKAHTIAKMALGMTGLCGTAKAPRLVPDDADFGNGATNPQLNDSLARAQTALMTGEQARNQIQAWMWAFKYADHKGMTADTPMAELVTFFSEGVYVLQGRFMAEVGNPEAARKREAAKVKREQRKAERAEPDRAAAAAAADEVLHPGTATAAEADITSESILFGPEGVVEANISQTAWNALRAGVGGADGAVLCRVSFLNGERNAIKLEVVKAGTLTVPKVGGGNVRVNVARVLTTRGEVVQPGSGNDTTPGGTGGQAA
jgi:hypothetical protein